MVLRCRIKLWEKHVQPLTAPCSYWVGCFAGLKFGYIMHRIAFHGNKSFFL